MIRGNKLYINITNHCDVCCPFCCMKSDSKKQSFMNFDTIHKIMKDMDVPKYQGIDMVSESANLVKLYEQKQIANDVVFEMIFHPNGNLNGSWVDNEDILLAYNSYKS